MGRACPRFTIEHSLLSSLNLSGVCEGAKLATMNQRKKARYEAGFQVFFQFLILSPFKEIRKTWEAVNFGVTDGARTHDNRNHNPGLYQLSYGHHCLVHYVLTVHIKYLLIYCFYLLLAV